VRSDGDRSFGFWPRRASRGNACAGGAAQVVAVTFRPLPNGIFGTRCAGEPLEGRGKPAQAVAVTVRPRSSELSDTAETGCTGEVAQAVRSDTDRSRGFWPRTAFRGSACAGEAAQAVVSSRVPASDSFFGSLSSSGSLSGSSSGSSYSSVTPKACADEAAQAVASLRDARFEY
jgi:hypothetical protein